MFMDQVDYILWPRAAANIIYFITIGPISDVLLRKILIVYIRHAMLLLSHFIGIITHTILYRYVKLTNN